MEQLNRLTAFRQAVYDHVLTKRRDAQQELLDALLLSPPVHSFPELSLSPAFRRAWPSLYKALSEGEHDERACYDLIMRQIPSKLVMVFPLDESAVPRPDAPTLADRGFVHSATPQVDGAGIVIGLITGFVWLRLLKLLCSLVARRAWASQRLCRRKPQISGGR